MSGRSVFLRTILPVLLLSTGGCSFLLDFPDQGASTSGGAGGKASTTVGTNAGGAGGKGAGGGSVCADFAPHPSFGKVAWRSEMKGPISTGDFVIASGVVRAEQKALVYVYGQTSAGLKDLFTGSGSHVGELFVVQVPDAGAATLAFGATACAASAGGQSGRFTVNSDGRPVISGMLGIDPTLMGPGTWSLSVSDTDSCTGATTNVPYDPAQYFNGSPFFAVVNDAVVNSNIPGGADGMGVDIDDHATHLAAIGIATGSVFDATNTEPTERFFVQRSTETTSDNTFILENHWREFHNAYAYAEAGVAVDNLGNAWFGGGSCNDNFMCPDQGAFFGVVTPTASPEIIVERPGVPSAINSVRIADDTVVVGGRYNGALTMLDATLPAGADTDAFVMAIDPTTRKTLWSYPSANTTATYDHTGYNTVVDMAVLGTRACGAVYVLGCTDPAGGTDANCVVPGPGKRGFLAKLDFATGQEISLDEIVLENPSFDIFLPTSITSNLNDLWIAGTASGKGTFAGGQVVGATPQETVLLQLSR